MSSVMGLSWNLFYFFEEINVIWSFVKDHYVVNKHSTSISARGV